MSFFQQPFTLNSFTYKEWPTSTKFVCDYDGEPFTTMPIPRVMHYDPNLASYTVMGNFCSVNCAKAYMLRLPTCTIDDIIVQEHLANHYFQIKCCKPAQNLSLLKKYGGTLSITQWRKKNIHPQSFKAPKHKSKKVEIPTSVYKKDIKAEAMIFGKCVHNDTTIKKQPTDPVTYGLQKFLVNI